MSAERTASHNGKAVLWLGASEAPLALVTHLRSRGITMVTGSDDHTPVARLMLVEAAVSPAARNASVKGRRVAVIHPDPGSADALAQALRGRGAQVVALSLNPEALERVEALDPDAVLMEVTDFYGSCWEIVRALWQHPRLKYAPVLLASPEGVASYAQGTPDVPSLCLAVQTVSATYERVERASRQDDEFDLELAELGAARLLRALTESQRNFRLTVASPEADFEVDVSQGIIAGAQGSAKGAANDLYLGVHALALLMTQERGQARARVADHPAATNVMAPLDAALHAAREVKAAAPQDAAATREVAARMSVPEVAAMTKPAVALESAPPPPAQTEETKRSTAAAVAPVATPPSAAKLPAGSADAKAPQRAEAAAPRAKKTLHGLPAPRRTTRTGRVMAVVPRENAEDPQARPAVQAAARPSPPQPAVAAAVALGSASAGAAVLQGEGQTALRADDVPTREFACAQDIQYEDSRVTVARGHGDHDATDGYAEDGAARPYESALQQPLPQPRAAFRYRPQRWHLVATLGVLGLLALGWLATRLFTQDSAEHAALPPAVPALPPPPPLPTPAASQPAATPQLAGQQAVGAAARDGDEEEQDDGSDADAASGGLPPARKASALVSQGHNLRKHRRYAQAKARYEAALALLPNYPRALAGLAQVAIAQNKGKDAVAYAQKLVQARPQRGNYQLLLGDAYKAANMPKEAQQAWQAAIRAGNATAKTRLKPASASSPTPKTGTAVKGAARSAR